jgi:chemotaxis protein methyltransferase CheR
VTSGHEIADARPARLSREAAGEVSDADFARFQGLIHRVAGIHLAPCKKALLAGRLSRRMRELGVPTLSAYYRRVQGDPGELTRMLDAISTNETHFFREPAHFDLLSRTLLPAWCAEGEAGTRPRRLRAWSAACSTGQEPFTLAMVLLAELEGWDVEILASDLSTAVLERARKAVWPLSLAREIPDRYRRGFMLRGTGPAEGTMKAGPELREVVRFARVNLVDPTAFPAGRYDLVFCRNVLIYFDAPTRRAVVERLIDRLAPGGLLFVGHAESLVNVTRRVRPLAPTVYVAEPAGDGTYATDERTAR